MFKRRNIGKWLVLTLFICFLLSGFASADENELNDSEANEISASIQEFANDPSFIACRGTIPETIDQEWKNSIVDCWLNLNRVGPSYSEFDSSISGVASNSEIIIIELGSAYKEEVDDSRIDEMYQKIEDYCEEQEGISEIPVVFMWAWDEEDLALPDYGPQIFEEAKKNPLFVAARGTMPVIKDASEKVEWTDSLVQCSRSLASPSKTDEGVMPYFVEFGGPVSSFGTDINGYLAVGFEGYSSEKVNESVIDEIYQVIDEQCEKKDISDVPVVFEYIGYITEAEAEVDEPDVNESNDTNLSGNEEEITGNGTNNQTPGFTSIMLVLSLLFLVKTRK
ncbi:hypothetical protein [Methanosarcina acetivorans]|uniref:Uncharacterized protein n=1 Tax=Methanosarcina acetivorans (strain ATCC 35395 / DSM 2834 / JCM 12185 / C2A) TaxID=188937 RepID=Q8TTW0_METAC|nr:hypothetical protein [Methanosarcina acetivorans]AAM03768.1 predicted protein [Methanosarcina acetivorans C2A]